ncbi:methionyl-tRNA formyltransferase [Candidatus Pantoea edessiphila]|uniref:Methionyl-tRNA formyltransferase n=1 Tax=Candidatus Pantoea edessiphila TaxID=2044610 RepID=A0A2P5SZX9_9GAMM|nr:methionyl-tRNA formyltransferase [Candidatus Pantoea edessiphila]
MKIIFAGTSKFAVSYLNYIIKSDHQVIAIFTQPDRPAGRGQKLTASPVKIFAQNKNIPFFQPDSLNSKQYEEIIANLNADIMIVVAYGLIIPVNILNIPYLGCINVHASLLPRWRGAAPIQRAILAGDKKTGITLIQMNEGLDTGNILYQIECDISSQDTSLTLSDKLSQLGLKGLISTLFKLSNNINCSIKQDKKLVTYAKKINKKEAKLNWMLSAETLDRCVRAYNPWPISFFYIKNKLIKVWKVNVLNDMSIRYTNPGEIINITHKGIQVNTSIGILNLICIQFEGKKPMLIKDLINSHYEWFIPGSQLQ